jgi:hypothetical protein
MGFLHHFNRKDVEKSFLLGIAEGKKVGRAATIEEIRRSLSGGYRDSAILGRFEKKSHKKNIRKSAKFPWYRLMACCTLVSGVISVSAVGLFCHSASTLVWFSALVLGMCVFWSLCLIVAIISK